MFDTFLNYASKIIVAIVGLGSIIIFLLGLAKGWWKFIKVFKKIDGFIISTCGIIPEILDGLEKSKAINQGTLAQWTKLRESNSFGVGSSIKVLPEGRKTLNEINFEETYKKNEGKFLSKLDEKLKIFDEVSPYDIERMSIDLIFELFDSNDLKSARDYLFERPHKSKAEMVTLIGIELRDKYIKHLEEQPKEKKE